LPLPENKEIFILKNFAALTSILLMLSFAQAQEPILPDPVNNQRDSARVQSLREVVVTGFEQNRSRLIATATVHVAQTNDLGVSNRTSLVQALNTVPGLRMEERSPGSYRINIRGSSLRSPFGVRNVKIYWNDIPVTDPGGNTYFNQFAFNNFSSIEVFRGPGGSLYGAGTGGVIIMNTLDGSWKRGVVAEYITGSFGLHNALVTARLGNKDARSQLTYAHTQHDGYRNQSAMRRDNASWASSFKLSNKQELSASLLFTDMFYQTPGGLTKTEFDQNPKAARPAAGGFPGAEQARAAIYQKNILAGVQHRYKIDTHWSNSTVLYAAYAQIRNSAVRNYERRSEPHTGGRTSFTWQTKKNRTAIKLVAGGELQHGFFNTQVFSNRQGNADTLQNNDDIDYDTYSIFLQGDVSLHDSWFITAGSSINQSKVRFTRLSNRPVSVQQRIYRQELAPRLSLVKKFGGNTSLFGTVSKGFSPPTLAELLPSTGRISTELEAESGWNYEAGARRQLRLSNGYLFMELTAFYFKLNNTLVQRRDNGGADFFINAGNTRQKGIEYSASYTKHFHPSHWLDDALMEVAYNYSHFRYGSFTRDTIDFSGKVLPSVPANTLSFLIDVRAKNGLYFNASHYWASKIFLNDANTAAAAPYHLLGLRIGYGWRIKNNISLNLYAGADNVLDEVYSLGNDINDARGRYYNTAPRRNYYAGVILQVNAK
jgi:iron complex outermembrane recepter protein